MRGHTPAAVFQQLIKLATIARLQADGKAVRKQPLQHLHHLIMHKVRRSGKMHHPAADRPKTKARQLLFQGIQTRRHQICQLVCHFRRRHTAHQTDKQRLDDKTFQRLNLLRHCRLCNTDLRRLGKRLLTASGTLLKTCEDG